MKLHARRVLAIILSIALVFGTTAYASAVSNDTAEELCVIEDAVYVELDEEVQELMEAQESAVQAHETLFASFEWGADDYDYPKDFGGDYIENDILYIQLTNLDRSTVAHYDKILTDYVGYYEYSLVEFSYTDLCGYVEEKANELIENGIAVSQYYPDVYPNAVGIELSSEEAYDAAQSYLLTSNNNYEVTVTSDVVSITNATENAIPINIKLGSEVETQTTYGGESISSNGYSLTLGAFGTYGGDSAFVTSGHDMKEGKSVSSSGYSDFGTIEEVVHSNNSVGDYAIGYTASGVTTTNKVKDTKTNNTYTITSTYGSPAVGTYLYKCGAVSGIAYGKVDKTGVTVTSNSSYKITKLTRVLLSTGSSASGDSGGPYFRNYNSALGFAGVHHGSATTSSSTYVYFTPYSYISSNSGFAVKTS